MPLGIYPGKLGYSVKPVAPTAAHLRSIRFDLSITICWPVPRAPGSAPGANFAVCRIRYWDTTGNWRTNIGQMLAPAEVKPHSIELHITPFTMHDGMILTIGCALLVFALL